MIFAQRIFLFSLLLGRGWDPEERMKKKGYDRLLKPFIFLHFKSIDFFFFFLLLLLSSLFPVYILDALSIKWNAKHENKNNKIQKVSYQIDFELQDKK